MTQEELGDYWQSYEGDFFFDQRHGKGRLQLSNGEVFVGEFSEEQVEGKGRFYHLTSEVTYGKWVRGFLV